MYSTPPAEKVYGVEVHCGGHESDIFFKKEMADYNMRILKKPEYFYLDSKTRKNPIFKNHKKSSILKSPLTLRCRRDIPNDIPFLQQIFSQLKDVIGSAGN